MRANAASFRLSNTAQEILRSLSSSRGQTKTAILERLLREELAREKGHKLPLLDRPGADLIETLLQRIPTSDLEAEDVLSSLPGPGFEVLLFRLRRIAGDELLEAYEKALRLSLEEKRK